MVENLKWLLIVLCIFISCNSTESQQKAAAKNKNLTVFEKETKAPFNLQLEPEQSFGDTKNIFFKNIQFFTMDDQQRIYIAQDSVLVFKPDGNYAHSIGAEGKGPEEFQTIGGLKTVDHRLFIYDAVLRRISIFSIDPVSYDHAVAVPDIEGKIVSSFFVKEGGTLWVAYQDVWQPGARRFGYLYAVRPTNGQLKRKNPILKYRIKDSFKSVSGGRIRAGVFTFTNTTLVCISGDKIYTDWTGAVLVKVYSSDGQYLRGFRHPFENKRIDYTSTFDDQSQLKKSDLPDFDFPETWPAVHSMVMDDQHRIWLSTIASDGEVYEWWVLGNRGRLLAKFRWPRNRIIKIIKQGKIYALQHDTKTGIPSVQRYNYTLKRSD